MFLSDFWYDINLFLFAIFDDDFFYSCFLLFILPDQAGDLFPWKTLGISPHGKYYRPLPWSPWANNTANKHLYRMCVSYLLSPTKITSSEIVLFYYNPLGPVEAPRWRRSDIYPDNTAYYIKARQSPLPPTKKEYRDPEAWVDPHLDIFWVPKPFVGGGSKKGKSESPAAAAN